MARACAFYEPRFAFEPTARWKRCGVVWSAVALNFSLWGALFWALGLVG